MIWYYVDITKFTDKPTGQINPSKLPILLLILKRHFFSLQRHWKNVWNLLKVQFTSCAQRVKKHHYKHIIRGEGGGQKHHCKHIQRKLFQRSYEIVFYALVLWGHYFIQYGFIQVCTFYLFFWKTSFLSFCAYCDYCLFWIRCTTLHKLLQHLYGVRKIAPGQGQGLVCRCVRCFYSRLSILT